MRGKLNIFQKVMLQWNEMHPYNAIHVARIQGRFDIDRLAAAINAGLEAAGLTGLVIDREKGTYHYHGGQAGTGIEILTGTGLPALFSEIERQLNTPFPVSAAFIPFRFFVLPAGDHLYLGLVYFHVISSAEPVVLLLKRIVGRYLGRTSGDDASPAPDLYPRGYCSLIRVGPKTLAWWLITAPSTVAALRKSFRPRYHDFGDPTTGFSFFSLGKREFQILVRAGKRWGVTLNDLFLALLLRALSPFSLERARSRRRKNITIASIVNIRKDLCQDPERSFGLFLGSFVVTHAVPDGITMRDLARDINAQTVKIKKHKLYLRMTAALGLARALIPLFSPDRRKKFYPKYYPLSGGITNVNLDTLWRPDDEGGAVDYFRTVSTGPASPLVLAITTVREKLNIGLSFKTTVYSRGEIEKLIMKFKEALNEIEVQT